MELKLSQRIMKPDFQGEFTASILAAAASPDVISFAGGLPNPVSFPVKEMEAATQKVLSEQGAVALQYSSTQGYLPLRQWAAKRYEVLGVTDVEADDIIITNGSQQALAMTYVPAQANGMTLGHAFVPEGFHVSADFSICDDGASVTNPMQAVFEASSPDGTVSMAYYSRRDFVQIVDAQGPSGQLRVHQDGVFDELFLTPMLTYQKANAYSALMALMIAGDESLALAFDEDMTPYQDAVDQQARRNYAASKQQLEPLGFTLEGAESTVAQPVYTVTLDGEDYCVTVFSWISGLQFSSGMATIFGPTKETDCAWAVDACFAMLCTPDRLEQMLPVFRLFVCNTTVSEQFIQANRQLSDAIRVGTVKGRSLSSFTGEGSSYLSAETSSGDDYDNIEAYTDYIFDQNDYTLSDGTHVKVSTDYGYVYQGDNSVVYISDSALYQPGGAVQLTPNR